jgi:hypothetical protein
MNNTTKTMSLPTNTQINTMEDSKILIELQIPNKLTHIFIVSKIGNTVRKKNQKLLLRNIINKSLSANSQVHRKIIKKTQTQTKKYLILHSFRDGNKVYNMKEIRK